MAGAADSPAGLPGVWAIADLHLSGGTGKTMDRFGERWVGHAAKVRENCKRLVGPGDVLLLPGDLSWAMRRADAAPDLAFIAALPGIKVAIKGNHDYWWESGKAISYPGLASPPMTFDMATAGSTGERPSLGVAGTRGWFVPEPGSENEAADRKILERERERLKRSLAAIADCGVKLAMTHYPPHPFLPELAAAGVTAVAYGHIHLGAPPADEALALDGQTIDGVRLYCVACDRIDFTPRRILARSATVSARRSPASSRISPSPS